MLVTGPAGSGKTVLVRQWFDRVGGPSAWLTLDQKDNDLARFWTYFVGAVAVATPTMEWPEGEQASAGGLELLAEQLGAGEPLTLVLDDMHFLVDRTVLDQLGQLVGLLPAKVRLILVSRARPQLRLARHHATGHLVEVRGEDLCSAVQRRRQQVLGRPNHDAHAAAVQADHRGGPSRSPSPHGCRSLVPAGRRMSTRQRGRASSSRTT